MNDDVKTEDLPSADVGEDDVCRCPFCQNRFVVRSRENNSSDEVGEIPNDYLRCTRCGHAWKGRGPRPKKCPRCGSYKWNDPEYVMQCMRCRHAWHSSSPEGPRRCPSCRSYDWKIPINPENSVFRPDPTEDTMKIWICKEYENGTPITEIASKYRLPVMKVMAMVKRYYGMDGVPRI